MRALTEPRAAFRQTNHPRKTADQRTMRLLSHNGYQEIVRAGVGGPFPARSPTRRSGSSGLCREAT